jgi:hypothetical protein
MPRCDHCASCKFYLYLLRVLNLVYLVYCGKAPPIYCGSAMQLLMPVSPAAVPVTPAHSIPAVRPLLRGRTTRWMLSQAGISAARARRLGGGPPEPRERHVFEFDPGAVVLAVEVVVAEQTHHLPRGVDARHYWSCLVYSQWCGRY